MIGRLRLSPRPRPPPLTLALPSLTASRRHVPLFSYANTCAPECVECYKKAAFDYNLSPAAFAIAFCDSRPFVTSTIIGATSAEQLEVNLQGFGVDWTDELEAEVARIHAYFPDPWRMIVRGGG